MNLQIGWSLQASAETFSQQHSNNESVGVQPSMHGNEQHTCPAPLWALLLLAKCNVRLTLQLVFALSGCPRRHLTEVT